MQQNNSTITNNNKILKRQLIGAINCTIDAHGLITKKYSLSSAKRIVGNLNKLNDIRYPNEPLKEKLLSYCSEMHVKLKKLRKQLYRKGITNEQKSFIGGQTSCLRRTLISINNIIKQQQDFDNTPKSKQFDDSDANCDCTKD